MGTVVEERARQSERLPPVREGRIASPPDANNRVMVTARSLTGDVERLGPCPGAHPIAVAGDPITLREAQRGDRCWIAGDEAGPGSVVVVTWEPVGA